MKRWIALLLLLAALPLSAATRTVTTTADSGPGSLRQALLDAQSGDRIEFAIGSGPQTIQPLSDLPANGNYVVIDGTTQPGYGGAPLIELTGNYPLTNIGLELNGEVTGLVINGFEGAGISIGNGIVRDCYIGTDRTGTVAMPNHEGILARQVIGAGAVPLEVRVEGNLISGNQRWGVLSYGHMRGLSVQGNTFGSNLAQTAPLGSSASHVAGRATAVRIGDELPNVFVGATSFALEVGNALITNNLFGVTSNGTLIPNHGGVWITDPSEVSGNTFRGNTHGAVRVTGGVGTKILANTMENDGFGIDLLGFGRELVNPNDDSDTDTGANNMLNYPVLGRGKIVGDTVVLTGSISVPAHRQHRIDLYANAVCNASGHGEGRDLIEAFEVMTDAAGRASFERVLPLMPIGTVITATTTSEEEGTSEFSACIAVEGPGVFAFESAAAEASEAGNASVIVRRNLGATGTASVSYAVIGGTAMPGVDFNGGSGTLTFADGETAKTISIPLVNDNLYEENETIQLQLSNPTGGTTIGSPATTIVTIRSDEFAPRIVGTRTRVTEGDGGTTPVDVRFTLSGPPSSVPQTFPYETALVPGATASADDFVHTAGTLTFQPGETEKFVTVHIVGDVRFEFDEDLWIRTSGGSGIITIVDNDPYPIVSVHDVAIAEGGPDERSTVLVTMTASQPISGSVRVTLIDETATFMEDHLGQSADVYFVNEATKTFPVTIVGDWTPEPNETVRVQIGNSLGGRGLFDYDRRTAVITILNDDLTVTPSERMLAVGESALFVFNFGSAVTADTLVRLGSYGSDSISVPSSMIVPAGASGGTFEVKALVPGRFARIQIAATGVGVQYVHIATYTKATLRFDAARLDLVEGETAGVSVSLDPPRETPLTISLTSTGPVSVPGTVTIPPGGTATFDVTATGTGAFTIDAHLPPEHGNEIHSLHGNARSADAVTPPRIELVQPSSGTISGGTHVRVTGSGFDSLCWLFFGGRPAEHVVVRDANTITATTPFYAPVAVDVTVRCGSGESTAAAAFQYRAGDDPAPFITSVEPTAGAPGQLVTIRGLHFLRDLTASFDVVDSFPDALVVRVPPLAPGRVAVTVTDRLGRSTTSGPIFDVLAARPVRVDAIAPAIVPAGGELELIGDGFHSGIAFEIGGRRAQVVTLDETHVVLRLAADTPAGTPTILGRDVIVTPLGTIVTGISRRCAPSTGDVVVDLLGRGFTSATEVFFDGVPATGVTLVNSTTLRVRVPAGEVGPVQIRAGNATLTGAFSYVSPFAPSGLCTGRVRASRP